MKKQITTILLLGIFLIGSVLAGIVANTIIVDKGNEAVLRSINIGDNVQLPYEVCDDGEEFEPLINNERDCWIEYKTTNLEVTDIQVGTNVKRCLYQEGGINKCQEFEGNNLVEREIWTKELLNSIAENEVIRDSRPIEVVIDDEIVSVSEK